MLIVIAGFPAVFIGVFFSGSLIIETIFSLGDFLKPFAFGYRHLLIRGLGRLECCGHTGGFH